MSKGLLIIALALVLVAGIFAWFVGVSLDGGEPRSLPLSTTRDTGEMTALLRSIDQRIEKLEQLVAKASLTEANSLNATQNAPESSAHAENVSPWLGSDAARAMAELTQALREFKSASLSSVPGSSPSALATLRDARPSPVWKAWQELWEKHAGDEEKMAYDLHFLTRYDILDRFGAPTRIRAGHWEYDRKASPGQVDNVTAYFVDGFVYRVSAAIAGN